MDKQSQSACLEVLEAWNRCHGAFYQADENDLRWNLERQQLVRYWREDLAGIPVLLAEAAPEGARQGVLAHALWISLYGEVRNGASFVAAAEEFARRSGKKRLAIGSDEFHFLPGVPVDDVSLAAACKAGGYTIADNADFMGSVDNPRSRAYIAEARKDLEARGWEFHGLRDARDREEMDAFLLREFKGRWHREWRMWVENEEDCARAFWHLLRDEHGKVLGFSRLAKRGRFAIPAAGWTPGAMRLPLAAGVPRSDTDSCLGPIGISKDERGRGAGKILLGLSLHELSLQSAKLTCIDWTNAYNYYTPLGFEIVRRFHCLWKEL